jgi:ADP-ribose pyrophosphatase YjhB (NUDIX family)
MSHAAQERPDHYCPKCGRRLTKRRRTPDGRSHPACGCGYIQFTNPKVVAGALPIRRGRVALLRRDLEPSLGLWTFPAGFVDRGETPVDAAVRETREESGLEVVPQRLLTLIATPGSPILIIVYLAAVRSGTLQALSECLEARWFARSEIPWRQLAFPSTATALKLWLAQHTRGNRLRLMT